MVTAPGGRPRLTKLEDEITTKPRHATPKRKATRGAAQAMSMIACLMGISAAVAAAATNVAAAAVNATMKGRRDFWECPLGVARGFAQDCGHKRAMIDEGLRSLRRCSAAACKIPAQGGMGQDKGLVSVRCARDTFVKLGTRDGAAAVAYVATAVAAAVTNIVVAVAVATAAVVSAALVRLWWSLDLGRASHKSATREHRTQGGVGHGTVIEGRPWKRDVCTDAIGDAGGRARGIKHGQSNYRNEQGKRHDRSQKPMIAIKSRAVFSV